LPEKKKSQKEEKKVCYKRKKRKMEKGRKGVARKKGRFVALDSTKEAV